MAYTYGRDDDEDAGSEGGFHSSYFVGDWIDSLGHHVTVMPVDPYRRKGANPTYLATLFKPGMPNKRFTIAKHRLKKEWMCGNGILVRAESGWETITWRAEDGRSSSWSRPVVEGPVYFDPPPEMQQAVYGNEADQIGMYGCGSPYFWFNDTSQEHASAPWKGLPLTQMFHQEPTSQGAHDAKEGTTPGSTPVRTPLMTPINTPLQTPMTRPAPPPLMPLPIPLTPEALAQLNALHTGGPASVQGGAAGREAVPEVPSDLELEVELVDGIAEAEAMGNRLEWCIRDAWGKLRKYPKDHCIASPLFGRRGQEKNMKIIYYPTGSKTAEPNHCTLALTRGTDSAGIKFEFSLNGRPGGPKVCLGRRIVGDYSKPFSDSEENDEDQVHVCFQVLEILARE